MLASLALLRGASGQSSENGLVTEHESAKKVEREEEGQGDEDVDAHRRALVDHDERGRVKPSGQRKKTQVDEEDCSKHSEIILDVGRVLDPEDGLEVEQHSDEVDECAHNLRTKHSPDGGVIIGQPAEARSGVVVAGHSDGQSDDQSRNSESGSSVEGHPTVVDVSKFGEHPVDVNRVDHDPGEEGDAEVVHAHGDEGAQEGQLS